MIASEENITTCTCPRCFVENFKLTNYEYCIGIVDICDRCLEDDEVNEKKIRSRPVDNRFESHETPMIEQICGQI